MPESKIDRMRRRPVQRVAEIVANQRGAQPKWTAEPGDVINVSGDWRLFCYEWGTEQDVRKVYHSGLDGGSAWSSPISMITDVYTKAEQEANDALVQIDLLEWSEESWYAEVGIGIVPSIQWGTEFHNLRPLTLPATTALGVFRPVPERDIVPGDCVRDSQKQVLVIGNLTGDSVVEGKYADGSPYRSPLATAKLSLVAREDPKFIAPPVIKDPCGQVVPGTSNRCLLPQGHQPLICDDDPPVIKEPEPAPLCRHEESLYGRCTACGMTWEQQAEQRQISINPEWDLITAVNGDVFNRWTDVHGTAFWHRSNVAEMLTDAEILALGPVRRCVPVTLPDDDAPAMYATVYRLDRRKVAAPNRPGQQMWPSDAQKFAAELLAAALHAESEER